MINEVELEAGEILRLRGPARIDVVRGRVLLVGAEYTAGETAIVSKFRSYGLKALEPSTLRVTLGGEGGLEKPEEGEEVIDSWIQISEELVKFSNGRLVALILGPIESGKTTLAAFITNYLIQRGRRVGLIEADIGQEDLAVPGTVAHVIPQGKFIWQRELKPERVHFVGCNSPQYCLIESVTALISSYNDLISKEVDAVVINTDGWVTPYSGINHKISIVRAVRPTHILCTDSELTAIMRRNFEPHIEVIQVPRPALIRERSREERRYLRHEAYLKFFGNSPVRVVNAREINIVNSCVLSGEEIDPSNLKNFVEIEEGLLGNVVFSSLWNGILNIVTPQVREVLDGIKVVSPDVRHVNVVHPGEPKGLLVGVLDKDLSDVSVGIVKDVDFKSGKITLITP